MLGTYTIPSGDDTKKMSYAGIKGDSSVDKASGLQSQFAAECKDLVDDLKKHGCSVSVGTYGFINREQASKIAKTGNKSYTINSTYYQFGLALDIDLKSKGAKITVGGEQYEDDDAVTYIVGAHGLAFKKTTSVSSSSKAKTCSFIKPKHIKNDSAATTVTYDGNESVGRTGDTSDTSEVGAATGASANSVSGASVASVAYFFSNQYASYAAEAESELLAGNRALANDTNVMSFVKSAASSSLRTFASGPNGEFMAWYPDYWGAYGNKTPYLELDSIELIDLTIEQNESSFFSHVYCQGVNSAGALTEIRNTQGVVSIESDTTALASAASGITGDESDYVVSDEVSAILKNLIYIPEGEEWRYTPKELYRRYGARPNKLSPVRTIIEEPDGATFEENPKYILPFLSALFAFMKNWAGQNKCTLKITFMPELFPGCRIKLKDFDISMYVESVSHNMDYQSGFTTSATCTCPVGTLVRGMVNPNYDIVGKDSKDTVKNSPIASVDPIAKIGNVASSVRG